MTAVVLNRRRRMAVAGIWAASTVGGIVLILASLAPSSDVTDSAFTLVMALAADGVMYASVGAVLAIRRPGSLVASVLMAGGALIIVTFNGFLFGAGLTLTNGPDDPVAGVASMVGGLVLYPALVVAGPALALVFPDGRLPGPRWRWAIAVLACMLTAGFLLAAVRPGLVNEGLAINPLGLSGDAWTQWGGVGIALSGLALALSLVLGIIAVVVRYRRGSGIQRAQLRWFLAANVATVAGAIVVLQGPLGAVLGGDTVSVALSTLVVAALFPPIRRRVQRAVDRRFDRARLDAERTVNAFTDQLRDEVHLVRLRTALVATADDAVRPVTALVWLRSGARLGR